MVTHGQYFFFIPGDEEERLARFVPTGTCLKNIFFVPNPPENKYIFMMKENACDSFNFVVGSVEKKYGATKEILPLQSLW